MEGEAEYSELQENEEAEEEEEEEEEDVPFVYPPGAHTRADLHDKEVLEGLIKAKDVKGMTKWAKRGSRFAQGLLGTMFLLGQGVPKNEALALKWLERAAEADLFVLVIDATRPELILPPEVLFRIQSRAVLVVLNKSDLAPGAAVPPGLPAGVALVRVSALTGAGCDDLRSVLARQADAFQQDAGAELIAVSARHAHALRRQVGHLHRAVLDFRHQSRARR